MYMLLIRNKDFTSYCECMNSKCIRYRNSNKTCLTFLNTMVPNKIQLSAEMLI